jgi:hypothetical protein
MVYLNHNQEHAFIRTPLAALALVFMLVIACTEQTQTGHTQNDPTSTSPALVDTATPVPTEPPPVVAVVIPSPSATPNSTSTVLPEATVKPGTATSTPDSTATATIPPEIFDTAAVPTETPPPYHFETSAEAEKAAIGLGCTGWANVTVAGVNYFRACADDSSLENSTTKPEHETEAKPTIAPELPSTPTTTDTTGPTVLPISTSVVVPEPTAPAYHFTTSVEAEAAANELGCTGSKTVKIDGVGYYRACANDSAFSIFAEGAKTTLSGQQCTLESDPTARFTSAPTDLSLIRSILSTGTAAGGVIKPHSYLFNNDSSGDGGGSKVRVPVYAVADSFVNAIAYYGTSVGTNEYLIFFDVTCEISFKYDHIAEVVPKLLAVAPSTPAQGSQTTRTELIPFEAGELIGYTAGAGGIGPWDFGAYDLTFTNQFANQERYVKGGLRQTLHTVCPYEYFTEPLRSQMLAKIGTYSTFEEGNPTCFTTERDVLGAASGAWFDSPELSFSSAKLSIALTEGYKVGITGIGSDMKVPTTDPTYLDPDLLTTSHCYLDNNRWLYLEIQAEGMQLALAQGMGACPVSLPAGATIYYR